MHAEYLNSITICIGAEEKNASRDCDQLIIQIGNKRKLSPK